MNSRHIEALSAGALESRSNIPLIRARYNDGTSHRLKEKHHANTLCRG